MCPVESSLGSRRPRVLGPRSTDGIPPGVMRVEAFLARTLRLIPWRPRSSRGGPGRSRSSSSPLGRRSCSRSENPPGPSTWSAPARWSCSTRVGPGPPRRGLQAPVAPLWPGPAFAVRAHEDALCYLVDQAVAKEVQATPSGLEYLTASLLRRERRAGLALESGRRPTSPAVRQAGVTAFQGPHSHNA